MTPIPLSLTQSFPPVSELSVLSFDPTTWLIFLLIFVFVLCIVLGFYIPPVHMLAGLIGFFLAFQIWEDIASLPLLTIILALSCFLFLEGAIETDW